MFFLINLLNKWQGNFYLPKRMGSLWVIWILNTFFMGTVLLTLSFLFFFLNREAGKETFPINFLKVDWSFLKDSVKAESSLHTWICTIDNLYSILFQKGFLLNERLNPLIRPKSQGAMSCTLLKKQAEKD